MRRKMIVGAWVAAGLATGLAAAGFQLYQPILPHANAAATAQAAAPAAQPAVRGLPDFSPLVERYGPAVVNINVTQAQKAGTAGPQLRGLDPDDPFYEFFRRFQNPGPQGEIPAQGLGSGFIVSADGLILTNAHVVRDASEVTVRLTDKREFKARVVGSDPQTDIAVLRIDASNLPAVKLGRSEDVRVGEWVVAIGSPFGFENSVSAGIVSAKGRALPDGTYVPFIQTDVAVNPGNSGGPLFNMKGEVIGINSQIYSRTGGYQGLSFAIPMDLAVRIQDQIVRHGKVTRGRIGVVIQEVSQPLADSFGLKKPEGALVSSVEKGSPAEKAGIEAGDVILGVDGKAVGRSIDLSSRIAEVRPGSKAKLDVWRKGAAREITVTVGELKAAVAAAAAPGGADPGRLGLAARALTPEEQAAAGVTGGVRVEHVTPNGAAARAGIRQGDIIVALNSTPVASVEQLREVISKSGKHAALLVRRDDARLFVPVELG
ncbi:MAG: peptidase [Betaproteobacteria bacterium RIFCSPLOWO2_02_FULL_67_26]|nr:MAG: peptidase [Betaproteobacteria bacterium RIFCSPLOWO2_02_FULL_67_26]